MNLETVSRTIQHRNIKICGLALLTLTFLAAPLLARADDGRGFDHVFIIMMENTGYNTLIGNPNAPFINFAAATTGLATNYFGVAHPSQPNYIAATSGALNGVVDDNDITIDVPNVVDQLEARGKTWKAYMQSYSLCTTPLDHACGNQLYERKHNPLITDKDLQTNAAREGNIDGSNQWDTHVSALIATGDTVLLDTVNAIMTSKSWTGNSVIFIMWDESDFTGTGPSGFGDTSGCCNANPGGGHVLTLVISRTQRFARSSGDAFNHYSMMATIEDNWHLGCLANTCDRKSVGPMGELVGPVGGF